MLTVYACENNTDTLYSVCSSIKFNDIFNGVFKFAVGPISGYYIANSRRKITFFFL